MLVSSRSLLTPRELQVFNLQRLAVLTASLSAATPDANVIWEAMRDKIHQPWREGLVRLYLTPSTRIGTDNFHCDDCRSQVSRVSSTQ